MNDPMAFRQDSVIRRRDASWCAGVHDDTTAEVHNNKNVKFLIWRE